jgi:hypothetical protein
VLSNGGFVMFDVLAMVFVGSAGSMTLLLFYLGFTENKSKRVGERPPAMATLPRAPRQTVNS